MPEERKEFYRNEIVNWYFPIVMKCREIAERVGIEDMDSVNLNNNLTENTKKESMVFDCCFDDGGELLLLFHIDGNIFLRVPLDLIDHKFERWFDFCRSARIGEIESKLEESHKEFMKLTRELGEAYKLKYKD